MDLLSELKYVHDYAPVFGKLCEERDAWSRIDKVVFSNNLKYVREHISEITDINQLFSENNKQLLDSICVVACKVQRSTYKMEDREEDRLRHDKFVTALCDAYDEYLVMENI